MNIPRYLFDIDLKAANLICSHPSLPGSENIVNEKIEYLPFGRPNFSSEEIDAVTRVMKSGWIGMGPETIAFEQELCAFLECIECSDSQLMYVCVGAISFGVGHWPRR